MNQQKITALLTLSSLSFCICTCAGCATTATLVVFDGTSGNPLPDVSAEQFGESSNYFGDRNETRQSLKPTGQDGTLVVDGAISPLRNNEIHLSRDGYAPAVVLTRGGPPARLMLCRRHISDLLGRQRT